MGTILEDYTFGKLPSHCQMPAQAVQNAFQHRHIWIWKSPTVTSIQNQATGHHCAPLPCWHIRLYLCGYVAGSGSVWHISETTWIQHTKFFPGHPGKLPQHADWYYFSDIAVGPPYLGAKVRQSLLETTPPTSNSDPDITGSMVPGCTAGSPGGLYTRTEGYSSRRC